MYKLIKCLILNTILAAVLCSGETFALTPTPTPRPPTPTPTETPTPGTQLPATISAACSLRYIFRDSIYPTTTDRTCGMLVQIKARSGVSYSYPTSCVIQRKHQSCVATLNLSQSGNPIPPGSIITYVTVNSEKLYRASGMEEIRGCTYTNGKVIASAVYDQNGTLMGANVNHQMMCKDAPY